MDRGYKEHEVGWDNSQIRRFWDFHSRCEAYEDNYFSKQVSEGLINFSLRYVDINGNILDYGAGKGHLIEYLLSNNMGNITGCDFSKSAVDCISNRFKNNAMFKRMLFIDNIPTSLKEVNFNCIFLIEVIEHLRDDFLDAILKEIYRVMKHGATLIVTTPNNENLSEGKVACPDCGAIFHAMQHIRSFTTVDLRTLFEAYDFKTVFCSDVNLLYYRKKGRVKNRIKKLYKILTKHPEPHIVYIGKK